MIENFIYKEGDSDLFSWGRGHKIVNITHIKKDICISNYDLERNKFSAFIRI